MGKKYNWNFWFQENCYGEMYGPTCPDCVNEDNVEVWRRYISQRISELMKDETMQEPEFQKILEQVKEDKRRRGEYDFPVAGFLRLMTDGDPHLQLPLPLQTWE